MRVFKFIKEIFKKFPLLLTTNTGLLIGVNILGACSLFTISPVVDFFLHPDLKGASPLTLKAMGFLESLGLPVSLKSWLLIFISLVALASLLMVLARYLILRTKYAVLGDTMAGAFGDFFNARWFFFSSSKQGMLLNTFTRELIVVGDAFGAMATFFASILQMVFFLAIPLYISWQVTLITLFLAFLFCLPFALLGKLSYKLGILNTNTSNNLISVIQENLSLAKVGLGFGNQDKASENLKKAFKAHRRATLKSQMIGISINTLYRPFGIIAMVVALITARSFNIPLSETTVLLLSLLQVAFAVSHLTAQKNSLENFFPSYEQIKRLRLQARNLKQVSGTKNFEGFKDKLTIQNLSFAYPKQSPVLEQINITIPKGKMIALVGASGAGKTTLIDLIMGFHQPQEGKIALDGIRLQEFEINSYRQKLGYVPQDSVLFNMTIRDNLLWTNPAATQEEIVQAAEEANAKEFIEQLPQNYDTIAGDRGVRLSGGQVQRLALARAILRKPQLLILDEATSSLDTYSERLIQQAIEKIAKETTVIAIAHRLSTIRNADYVYVLKKGQLIEQGTYSELVENDSHFNQMVKLQALGVGE